VLSCIVQGDLCSHCGHPFIRSFCSFETLPLVQFHLDAALSHDEAMRLIETDPDSKQSGRKKKADEAAAADPNVQTLTIGGGGDDDDGPGGGGGGGGDKKADDPFQAALLEPGLDGKFPPIRVDAAMLLAMRKEDVFVRPWPAPNSPFQYFRYTSHLPPHTLRCAMLNN
jgi:intraflagellar transport protein 122